MAGGEKALKRQLLLSEILLKEAQPLLTGEPRVWARQFGSRVTFGETMGQVARTKVPFGKGAMRTDVVVFHDIPTQQGLLHVVQNYSGLHVQPPDFLIVIDKSIPRAAYVKHGLLSDQWATVLTDAKKHDGFKEFLDGIQRGSGLSADRLLSYARWTYQVGRTEVELPYTMQLIPLGNGKFVYLFKMKFKVGFWSVKQMKFRVEEFLKLAAWLQEALEAYVYDGPPAPVEVPIPTLSMLAIPELAGLIPNPGVEIAWPVDPTEIVSVQPAEPPPVAAPAVPSGAGQPRAEKFCIACGRKITVQARFCPFCGSGQQ